MKRVLVTGATGQIGNEVVSQLRGTGCRVRAMTRNPRSAHLPPDIEIVPGDLSAPDTLDACLDGIDSVFLLWIAPLAAAAPALERIAAHARQIVLLTSPHRTPHPFFQQPNALRVIHAGVEQLIEASGLRWTFLRPGPFAINCRNWWAPQLRNGDVVRSGHIHSWRRWRHGLGIRNLHRHKRGGHHRRQRQLFVGVAQVEWQVALLPRHLQLGPTATCGSSC